MDYVPRIADKTILDFVAGCQEHKNVLLVEGAPQALFTLSGGIRVINLPAYLLERLPRCLPG